MWARRDLQALAITQPESSGGARATPFGETRLEAARLDYGERGRRRPFALARWTITQYRSVSRNGNCRPLPYSRHLHGEQAQPGTITRAIQ